jgi:hypothetical protein
MAWDAAVTSLTQVTSLTNTEKFFTEVINPNPGETVDITFKVVRIGTTDNVKINLYSELDGTNPDTQPFATLIIDVSVAATTYASMSVSGKYQIYIGCITLGATDTHTSVDCDYRGDGISL